MNGNSDSRLRATLLPSIMIGVIAGIDNIAAALAMGALIFSGPLASGMGLGVGVILLGGALLSLTVALRSVLPNSIALVQETTIAILAAAIVSMTLVSTGNTETRIATAIALMGASSLTTGVVFWITGRLKLGGLIRFLPYPVIAGFLAGSGWLLIDGASMVLTGQSLGSGLVTKLAEPNVFWRVAPALVLAIVLFMALNRLNHPLTMPALMVIAVAVFYLVLNATGNSIELARSLGHLPQPNASGSIELPALDLLTKVDWMAIAQASPSLLAIAGLGMVAFMLNISGLELAVGRDLDVNAELRSSGIGNLLSGSVGGPSGFVGLSMTVLAERTGATNRGAGIATAIAMIIGLFVAGSFIFLVPLFLTGGFLLYLGAELLKEWLVDTRNRLPLSEWSIIVVILLAIALIGFMEGLAVGLLVSSAVFVFKYSRSPVIRFQATGAERRSNVDRSAAHIKILSKYGSAIKVVQLQGYLFFGTADNVVNIVRNRLAEADTKPLRFIILDFQYVSGADSAAIACFVKIRKMVEGQNTTIFYTSVPAEIQRLLILAGITFDKNDGMVLENDIDHALEKAEEDVLSEFQLDDGKKELLHHFIAAIGAHPRLPNLIAEMDKQNLQPEETLITQGDNADDVFFVASGRVRVEIKLPNGTSIRVRTMLGGAVVGEIALYLRQPRSADVIVDAPSEIFRLSADKLILLEQNDPELAALAHRLLASNLSEKLSAANKLIELTRN